MGSGNQKSEIQQYKSKPSSLEIALKLRKMPSLKLNYSSSAFSRALLHNKKVGTRYFGENILNSLHALSWQPGRLGWDQLSGQPPTHFERPQATQPTKRFSGLRKASLGT